MSRRFTSILLSLLLAPSLSVAQMQDQLVKGQRIRVVSRCEVLRAAAPRCPGLGDPSPYEWTYSGQVEALNADSMAIRGARIPGASSEVAFAIPTASIVRLSVGDGTRGHFWEGAGLGFLVGGVAGILAGHAHDAGSGSMDIGAIGGSIAIWLGVWGGTTIVGGVIGNGIKSDRWRPVAIKDHPISVAPRLDALGFTMTVAF
jgi:hypothetical protein